MKNGLSIVSYGLATIAGICFIGGLTLIVTEGRV
jgi:hypothetical protein